MRLASKHNTSDCVLRDGQAKEKKPQKNTQSFFILPQQTVNHADMLFIRVCVCVCVCVRESVYMCDKDCVYVYKEVPRPPTARTSFRG